MRQIALTDLAGHGITYEQTTAKTAAVTLPDGTVVPCELQGEEIWLFPERASAHRKLLAALDRPYVEPEPAP